ncbi:MAG: hypothetical protein AAGH38_07495 [Pseudomonadota bacterium]
MNFDGDEIDAQLRLRFAIVVQALMAEIGEDRLDLGIDHGQEFGKPSRQFALGQAALRIGCRENIADLFEPKRVGADDKPFARRLRARHRGDIGFRDLSDIDRASMQLRISGHLLVQRRVDRGQRG